MLGRWSSALLSAIAIGAFAPFVSAQTVSRSALELPPATATPMASSTTSQPLFVPPPAASCDSVGGCTDTAKPEHFTPFMLGDFIGPVANLFSDVKIAEGESPRPTDRVYYHFNYYNNLDQADTRLLTTGFQNVNLYQSVFGMEKTFLDQKVSVGLRVPFYTLTADGKDFLSTDSTGATTVQHGASVNETEFGNIAAVAKMVLLEDKQTGSLVSGGATLSFPTASTVNLNPGQSLLVYVQPYAGFIWQRGDLYVQGFGSITLPIARPEAIVLFNDLGVGYYVYRDGSGLLRAVAPTAEIHVATPLRQADRSVLDFGVFDDVKLHDVVDVTLGGTVEMAGGATLGLGVAAPLTGPKPFDFEVLVQLNYRF